jgi:competence protein ComEC
MAGIVAAAASPMAVWEGTLLAGAGFAGWWLAGKRRLGMAAGMALLVAFAGLGALRSAGQREDAPRLNVGSGERAMLEGCVVEPALTIDGRYRFVVEVAPGARVRVSAPAGQYRPTYGDRARGAAKILEPSEFRNPGAFSYRGWLARRSIYWVASSSNTDAASPETQWTRTGDGCGSPAAAWLHRTRTSLLARLDSLYGGDRYHAAMMRGLLLGDASSIEKIWVEDFRRTGTYHALVISGGHVAFLTGLFLLWIRLSRAGWHAVLLCAAGTAWLYSLLAGGEAPVVRSAAGFTLYAAARLVYRRARLLNLLSLVALVFLAIEPTQLFEASFQLSFLAVAAIAALAEPLSQRYFQPLATVASRLRDNGAFQRIPEPPRTAALLVELQLAARTLAAFLRLPLPRVKQWLAGTLHLFHWAGASLLVSACVQLALALPMILYFHRVSWTGLTANLLVTPIVTAAIPFGFAAIATGWGPFAALSAWLLDAARTLAALHAEWEFSFRVPDPPLLLSCGIAGATVVWAICVRRGTRWEMPAAALALGLLGFAVVYPFPPDHAGGRLEFTALDVGNGDSLFLGLPNGGAVLVDSGGLPSRPGAPARIDTGEDIVSPYLWSRRYRRLEAIALTHLDNDHSGGMEALLRNFRPREFWTGDLPDTPRARRLLAAAREAGATVVRLQPGQSFSLGGAEWRVVSAAPSTFRENDTSLVMQVRYGRQTILLTGDLERPGEELVLGRGLALRSAVLKVSHHGSRTGTSAAFVEAVRPALALISAGRHNQYGFPHQTVLHTLEGARAQILRTDLLGAVTVRTDGRSWESHAPAQILRSGPFQPVE